MKNHVFKHGAAGWIFSGSHFPLLLGGQRVSTPTRISIGFVVTHVANRLGGVEGFHAGVGKLPPASVIAALPIKWRSPLLIVDGIPAFREPQCRAPVAAVSHELHIFAVGHNPRSQRKRLQQNFVTGTFVVKAKSLACMADLMNTPFEFDPAQPWGSRARTGIVGRLWPQRTGP